MKAALLILFCSVLTVFADVSLEFPDVLKRAKEGDLKSQGEVALRYMAGDGVVQNYSQSLIWAKHAANRGNRLAQFVLGSLYNDGKGVPENKDDAYKWYLRSANQGNARAQYALAFMPILGTVKKPSKVEGYKWFLIASAEQSSDTKKEFALLEAQYKALSKAEIQQAQQLASGFSVKKEIEK